MVDSVYWENEVEWIVFVDTWVGGLGRLVGGREGGVSNGRLNVITHYLLLDWGRPRLNHTFLSSHL